VTAVAELRVPPGRAGRLWLLRRLRGARLAGDLLDRKLRILQGEQARLRALARDTGAAWAAGWRAADRWGQRTAALAGRRELRLAATAPPVEVRVRWDTVMGLRHPAEATCRTPDPPAGARSPGTAAAVEAVGAYREAVRAAAAYAVARSACRAVENEVVATRRRRRAITQRWVPRLEAALRDHDRRLEEAERAEAVRLRWAGTRGRHRQPG
jgi:V/A-type H+-transporting ATPase subunit D